MHRMSNAGQWVNYSVVMIFFVLCACVRACVGFLAQANVCGFGP